MKNTTVLFLLLFINACNQKTDQTKKVFEKNDIQNSEIDIYSISIATGFKGSTFAGKKYKTINSKYDDVISFAHNINDKINSDYNGGCIEIADFKKDSTVTVNPYNVDVCNVNSLIANGKPYKAVVHRYSLTKNGFKIHYNNEEILEYCEIGTERCLYP